MENNGNVRRYYAVLRIVKERYSNVLWRSNNPWIRELVRNALQVESTPVIEIVFRYYGPVELGNIIVSLRPEFSDLSFSERFQKSWNFAKFLGNPLYWNATEESLSEFIPRMAFHPKNPRPLQTIISELKSLYAMNPIFWNGNPPS